MDELDRQWIANDFLRIERKLKIIEDKLDRVLSEEEDDETLYLTPEQRREKQQLFNDLCDNLLVVARKGK